MTTERDAQTRFVLSWLREDTHENAERVLLRALDEVDSTPQRRSWWAAWRNIRMNKLAQAAGAAVAVLAVALVGYGLLPRLGILGPGATPSPGQVLLARGTFITVRGAVELEAFSVGSDVAGHMTVSAGEGSEAGSFTVDLQCARETGDGYLMIGGYTVATTGNGGPGSPVGTPAAVVFKRGSPVLATVWAIRGGGTAATSCAAYLDERFEEKLQDSVMDDDDPNPIEGTVELAP